MSDIDNRRVTVPFVDVVGLQATGVQVELLLLVLVKKIRY